jgi:hypothetical protein
VESYFRTIFRVVINNDQKAKSDAHTYTVPFGAVLYQGKDTIAEALLEGISFASEENIRKAFNKFLEISSLPDDIKTILLEFEKICHMRHCCVHRFGKLGAQNGIALGLEAHSKALEKPLAISKPSLEDMASWLMSFVKTINNFMFRTLLDRSANDKNEHRIEWKWVYKKDRAKFNRLYMLFCTTRDGVVSPQPEDLYERFKLAKMRRMPAVSGGSNRQRSTGNAAQ